MNAPKPQPKPRDWRCDCGGTSVGNCLSVAMLAPCCGKPLRPV